MRISLEVKVALFLLLAAGLLAAFVLVLGNVQFSAAREFSIRYTSSGGLRPGAKVKIAGVPAGKVKSVEFLDGSSSDAKGNALWVGVGIEVEQAKAGAITPDSKFFITSEGMLGEKYVEIAPGSPNQAPLSEGTQVIGEPVLELPVVTARAMEVMDAVKGAVESNGGSIEDVFRDAREILARTNHILAELEERVPGLVDESRGLVRRMDGSLVKADAMMARGTSLLDGEDGLEPGIRRASRMLATLEEKSGPMLEELELLLEEGRSLVADGRGVAEQLGALSSSAETELQRVSGDGRRVLGQVSTLLAGVDGKKLSEELIGSVGKLAGSAAELTRRVESVLGRTESLLGQVDGVVAAIKGGKGTLGALLTDREMYDDIRELILDLKKNPWKVIWKP